MCVCVCMCIGLVSLFSGISNIMSYLMLKPSLKISSGTI